MLWGFGGGNGFHQTDFSHLTTPTFSCFHLLALPSWWRVVFVAVGFVLFLFFLLLSFSKAPHVWFPLGRSTVFCARATDILREPLHKPRKQTKHVNMFITEQCTNTNTTKTNPPKMSSNDRGLGASEASPPSKPKERKQKTVFSQDSSLVTSPSSKQA